MYKTQKLSWLGLLINAAFFVYHIAFGVITRSWWLFTLGVYYAMLSVVRLVVLQIRKSDTFVLRFASAMLMLLSLPLVGVVILAVVRDRGVVMHEILMITMATYAFTKITLAIINLVKAQKGASAKMIALRNISLADACVSIFALQRSMLVSFGEMSDTNISIFNATVGAFVCVTVFSLGFNLARSRKA